MPSESRENVNCHNGIPLRFRVRGIVINYVALPPRLEGPVLGF